MPYKKNYVCGNCNSFYTIKQIEKMGIYHLKPINDTIWHCINCDANNLFFNWELRYMPQIEEVDLNE